jgi:large subunit ribosomal protein L25
MQEMPLLNVTIRDAIGGGRVKRLRHEGYIPAIIYGKGIDAISTKIKTSELRTAINKYGRNTVFQVSLPEQDSFYVVIKEAQHDVITEEIIHVDLQSISLTEKRRAQVPVRIVGRETVEVGHLILIQQLDEIEVECLPQETPQFVEIDVSELSLGDSITAGQIELPENVTLETDADQLIVTVTEVREVAEEDEETEDEETEDEIDADVDAEDEKEHSED